MRTISIALALVALVGATAHADSARVPNQAEAFVFDPALTLPHDAFDDLLAPLRAEIVAKALEPPALGLLDSLSAIPTAAAQPADFAAFKPERQAVRAAARPDVLTESAQGRAVIIIESSEGSIDLIELVSTALR